MAFTEKTRLESGHIIHLFSSQFAQQYTGWKKQIICMFASSAIFASLPLIFLCIAFLWFGNLFSDGHISKMTVAAFIFVSVFFSIAIPACEQLHAKLSSPFDWIVPGFIFACSVIFSLILFMYIRPPADAVSDLIAHGSRLRPLPITSRDIMATSGILLSLLISFSFYRRSKRKLLSFQQ
jgi:hypothetical protein